MFFKSVEYITEGYSENESVNCLSFGDYLCFNGNHSINAETFDLLLFYISIFVKAHKSIDFFNFGFEFFLGDRNVTSLFTIIIDRNQNNLLMERQVIDYIIFFTGH